MNLYEIFLYFGDSDNGDKLGEIHSYTPYDAILKVKNFTHSIAKVLRNDHKNGAEVLVKDKVGQEWIYISQLRRAR